MTTVALGALRQCRTNMRAARADAEVAATKLSPARAARAGQLIEMIGDALALAERLAVVVEADIRYERQQG
jgi:hypothetical protein